MPLRPKFLPLLFAALVGGASPCGRAQIMGPSGFPQPAREIQSPRVTGNPLLRRWLPEDYEAGLGSHRLVQHPGTGVIFAGNTDGVLEFDGLRWRLLPLPRGGAARDLAVDASGRIWVAGENEIARLEPDAAGELRAVAVEGVLPPDEAGWQSAHAAPGGVGFAGRQAIAYVRPEGGVEMWRTPERFGSIWWMDEALHAVVADRDIVRLEPGGRLTLIFTRERPEVSAARSGAFEVFGARRDRPGEWLLLTTVGPVRWNAVARTWRPMPLPPSMFRGIEAIAATFLAGGAMAFTGPRGGVVIVSASGRVERLIDRMPPIVGPRIRHFMEDREGGLWISAQDRIVRMQLQSPVARHEAPHGVHASPRRLIRHAGALYLAQGEGVSQYLEGPGVFRALEGLRRGVDDLAVVAGRLLAASGGLFELGDDGRFRGWSEEPVAALSGVAGVPRALLAGDAQGLAIWWREGADWSRAGRLAGATFGVASIHDTGDRRVWGTTTDGRVWQTDFRKGVAPDAPATLYGEAQGVPAVERGFRPVILKIGEFVMITAPGWLLRFDPTTGRFVPATGIAGLPPSLQAGSEAVETNADGSLWFRLGAPDRRLLHVAPDGAGGWKAAERPALMFQELAVRDLYEDNGTLWIMGRDQLYSFDLAWNAPQSWPLPPQIRRVRAEDGKVWWADGATNAAPLVLPAGRHTLRFELAAARFAPDHRGRPLAWFRSRLEGLEDDWTPWSPEGWRDFSSLAPGRYRFHLQASDSTRDGGKETTLALVVATPWWVAPWAWTVYVVAGVMVLRALVIFRTRALQRRTAQLESVVAARTEELRRSNAELARLNRLELAETAMARLGEEKARLEMLRYQLNPHFLYNALNSVYGLVLTAPRAAADMVLRLAEFCRVALTRAEESSTVGACFDRLALYLNIEKVRWKETLHVEIILEEEARDRRLPPFLLQPLVENAIKYGGSTSPEELMVRLVARVEPPAEPGGQFWLLLEVANTGAWVEPSAAQAAGNTGLGLANLRQRLERTHPGAHEIIREANDGWVVVRIRLRLPAVEPRGVAAGERGAENAKSRPAGPA